MLYQIQKYSNVDWNAQREVIDQVNFELESDAIAWKDTVVASLDQTPDGYSYALVPSTHPWFVSDTDTNTVETAVEQVGEPETAVVSDGASNNQYTGPNADFQEVYEYERQMSQKLRIEQVELELKRQAAIAKLMD
jgi:hypothetical protein